jgi:hypothetical protein
VTIYTIISFLLAAFYIVTSSMILASLRRIYSKQSTTTQSSRANETVSTNGKPVSKRRAASQKRRKQRTLYVVAARLLVSGLALVGSVVCSVCFATQATSLYSVYTFTWLWISVHTFLNIKAAFSILAFNVPSTGTSGVSMSSRSRKNTTSGKDSHSQFAETSERASNAV